LVIDYRNFDADRVLPYADEININYRRPDQNWVNIPKRCTNQNTYLFKVFYVTNLNPEWSENVTLTIKLKNETWFEYYYFNYFFYILLLEPILRIYITLH